MYDAVWYYKDIVGSEELRYSMRSACENLSIKRIILLCELIDKPSWFVETPRSIFIRSKNVLNYENIKIDQSWFHLRKLLGAGVLGEEFLLFNDDFFVLKPIKEWVDFHRDPNDYNEKALNNRPFHKRTAATWTIYPGYPYNLHMPMRFETDKLATMMNWWEKQPYKNLDMRTLYGCMFPTKTAPHKDVKGDWSSGDFFSSSNNFNGCPDGERIKAMFNHLSIAESEV